VGRLGLTQSRPWSMVGRVLGGSAVPPRRSSGSVCAKDGLSHQPYCVGSSQPPNLWSGQGHRSPVSHSLAASARRCLSRHRFRTAPPSRSYLPSGLGTTRYPLLSPEALLPLSRLMPLHPKRCGRFFPFQHKFSDGPLHLIKNTHPSHILCWEIPLKSAQTASKLGALRIASCMAEATLRPHPAQNRLNRALKGRLTFAVR